ncbi:MAG: DUF1501 domain-containing protein [Bdellovibrionales bacterium]|nr:DUF1501 domain-containing protein [Bdellovibrionales bacterium]
MSISRRVFLTSGASTLVAGTLSRFLAPSILIGESQVAAGAGQFFVNVICSGGMDGFFAFPPLGSRFGTLKAVRSFSAGTASSPVFVGVMGSSDESQFHVPGVLSAGIGVHPLLQTPYASDTLSIGGMLATGQGRVVGCVGASTHDGSHDSAMATLLTGENSWTSGSSLHWLAKWMDDAEMDPVQVWRLGKQIGYPFARNGPLPITVEHLDSFAWNDRGASLGGSAEAELSHDLAKELLRRQTRLTETEEKTRKALEETIDMVDLVSPFRNEVVRPDYSYRSPFRDAAKIIRHLALSGSNRTTYVQITLDNFDHHSAMNENLGAYLSFLNREIGILQAELAHLCWDRTVVTLVSEFGRKLATGAESGADHGYGNNLLVLSGGLRAGVALAGSLPTLAEIQGGYVVTPTVDTRQIYYEVLEWLGHDPREAFPEYTPRVPLRLFA